MAVTEKTDEKNTGDILTVTAEPIGDGPNEKTTEYVSTDGNAVKAADAAADSRTYYCEKCKAPYDLPTGATSWRCSNCSTFNSTVPAECPCCSIM